MSKQDKDVVEGNKLIAEFMDVKYFTEFHGSLCEIDSEEGSPWSYDPIAWLDYEKNWSLLMPVVEKIESLGNYGVEISYFSCHIYEASIDPSDLVIDAHFDSKIEAVWQAVVKFIQWYKQKESK